MQDRGQRPVREAGRGPMCWCSALPWPGPTPARWSSSGAWSSLP